jgi:hypothetical protein
MSSHADQEIQRRAIRFGLATGKFAFPDDFDADDALIERLFNGEAVDPAKCGLAAFEANADEESSSIAPLNQP